MSTPASSPSSSRDVETVDRFIAADASAIFDLIADPARHQDIDGSGTVRDTNSSRSRAAPT